MTAWCVGEFDYLESSMEGGPIVRVYTPVGKKAQGQFALDCTTRILQCYNEFFQLKYPLPLLNMLAIDDFSSGAMENFGCVTYRSASLLYDDGNSTADTRQLIALSVTHEVSHQWFGDLVSMSSHQPAHPYQRNACVYCIAST